MTFTNVLENLSIAKQEVTTVFNDAEEVGNWGKQIESKHQRRCVYEWRGYQTYRGTE